MIMLSLLHKFITFFFFQCVHFTAEAEGTD
uniref:Uncharacterized protein n=1 Tax=Rhizophora mucronata TaxID=61149 RepID=A0A2P2QH44_RHIMU